MGSFFRKNSRCSTKALTCLIILTFVSVFVYLEFFARNKHFQKLISTDQNANAKSTHSISQLSEEEIFANQSKLDNSSTYNPGQKLGNKTELDDDVSPSKFQVPNTVHYIWYNKDTVAMKFHHMLSVFSAYKNIKPDVIYFHTNNPPNGKYWDKVLAIPTLKIVKREPTLTLFGEHLMKAPFDTSYSNWDRVKVLMEYGGIYMDLDVIAIGSFNDLRRYPCTMGYELKGRLCGGIIVAARNSTFLYLWMNAFLDDNRPGHWAYNTGVVPSKLSQRYPNLIHLEHDTMNRPNWDELQYIIGDKTFNWKEKYSLHLWYRLWKQHSKEAIVDIDEDNVKTLNNTFGQIARHILYDI